MWKEIGDRQSGKLRPNSFISRIRSNRASSLQLSNHKEIVSPHRGAINSLQVFIFLLYFTSSYLNLLFYSVFPEVNFLLKIKEKAIYVMINTYYSYGTIICIFNIASHVLVCHRYLLSIPNHYRFVINPEN